MIGQAKFAGLYEGLNSVAKKVYEACPMATAWTVHQIVGELARLQTPMEARVVHGALGHMASAGLLRERPKGCFVREVVRKPNSKPTVMEEAMATAEIKTIVPATLQSATAHAPAAKTQGNALESLGMLSARVANAAKLLEELAADIQDAVIEAQVQQEQGTEELRKLRQLKELLQGL